MTVNEKMIARIDAALDIIPETDPLNHNGAPEDRRVLLYIRRQLTPEGLDERDEWDKAVDHLFDVAERRLHPYETKMKKEAVSV